MHHIHSGFYSVQVDPWLIKIANLGDMFYSCVIPKNHSVIESRQTSIMKRISIISSRARRKEPFYHKPCHGSFIW